MVKGVLRRILQAEGAVELLVFLALYHQQSASWGFFLACFLFPDLSMFGYFANKRVGAALYNALHTYIGPALLFAFSWHRSVLGMELGLIWAAHIAFDRMLGYGLKYSTSFGDSHLGQKGRSATELKMDTTRV